MTRPDLMEHPETSQITLVGLLRAVADPVRLEILNIVASEGEQTCAALAARLDLPLSTLSHHLRVLRESGVAHSRRSGTQRWLSLRTEDLEVRFPGLLPALLDASGGSSTSEIEPGC
jgi:DNA-binding transcriptional ArsR family regulator